MFHQRIERRPAAQVQQGQYIYVTTENEAVRVVKVSQWKLKIYISYLSYTRTQSGYVTDTAWYRPEEAVSVVIR